VVCLMTVSPPGSSDTVAIVGIVAGIIGTLLGAGLGAFVTWKIQKRQLEHEDRTRFHERRLEVYAEFNEAASEVLAAKQTGNNWVAGLARMNKNFETLKLIASQSVIDAAIPVQGLVTDVVNDRIADIPGVMPKYYGDSNALTDAMREELGADKALKG